MKIHISFLFRTVFASILVFICTISIFSSFSFKMKNHYLTVASLQADKVATLVCLNSISALIKEKYSQVDFISEDSSTLLNTNQMNVFILEAVNLSYQELKNVEKGESTYFTSEFGKGIIYEIPFNLVSDNVFMSSFGPRLPVKFSIIGDIKGKMISKVEEFGINNALINLNLLLSVSSQIFVPLTSNLVSTEIEIPVYSRIYNGKVPSFFTSSINQVSEVYSTEIKL